MAENQPSTLKETQTTNGNRRVPKQSSSKVDAEVHRWLDHIRRWYPDLHTQTYFLPPLHFNRVQYDRESVAGNVVLVPKMAADAVNEQSLNITSNAPVGTCHLPLVFDSNVRDDQSQECILRCLHRIADEMKEVMMVVSQLDFLKYLEKTKPAAVASRFPRSIDLDRIYHRGDFDILIIHSKYGLITGEIKSVGHNFSKLQLSQLEEDEIIAKTVKKVVFQMNKCDVVLKHLVSDLPEVSVAKTLMFPNVSTRALTRALSRDSDTERALRESLGVETLEDAVQLCLCKPSSDSRELPFPVVEGWWHSLLKVCTPLPADSQALYEHLVARFCGPASTIEIFCVAPPRLELRTVSEAIAETGNRIAQLCLYPEQLYVLNSTDPRVFITGPPGTGKTVMLQLKGLQWLRQDKDVHIVSTSPASRSVSFLLEHQLNMTVSSDREASRSLVHLHQFDFNKQDANIAVKSLKKNASNGELFVIADEIHDRVLQRFGDFCTLLVSKVPAVHLWAASLYNELQDILSSVKMTVPLRSSPVVVSEVKKSIKVGRSVYEYSTNGIPAPTDGPSVRYLVHSNLAGHCEDTAGDCEECGRNIARVLTELRVGVNDGVSNCRLQLHYRDVFVLCMCPRVDQTDSGLVRGLRGEFEIPLKVVDYDASDSEIRDMVIAQTNEVIVTSWSNVQGLERKIVFLVDSWGLDDILLLRSRSTSQLVVIT